MEQNELTKELSSYLSKHLQDKGVKQSELLEIMSHFHGFKDWNTLKAQSNVNFNKDDPDWSKSHYMHIDNGGLTFSYNQKKKILMLETSFFGYTSNIHFFKITKKEIDKFFFHIQKNYDAYVNNQKPLSISGEGWTLEEAVVTFYNQNQSVQFFLYHFSDEDFKKLYKSLFPQSISENIEKVDSNATDNSIFAIFTYPNNGYEHEQLTVKKFGFKVGQKFKVTDIRMGNTSTSIYLEGYNQAFNSILFEFQKANGISYDIYSDPKYNDRLRLDYF